MKSRSVAREIALCVMFQCDAKHTDFAVIEKTRFSELVLDTVRTLTSMAKDQLQSTGEDVANLMNWIDDAEIAHPVNAKVPLDQPTNPAPLQTTHDLKQRLNTLLAGIESIYQALELPELNALAQRDDVHNYALMLCRLVNNKQAEFDEAINSVSSDWRAERLQKMDRLLLHMAIAETRNSETAQPATVIDEWLSLANRYSTEDARKLIHGILGALNAEEESTPESASHV